MDLRGPLFSEVNECFKQMFMAIGEAAAGTRERIEAAAAALFAERGLHGTTMRDIARRARTNVASANYHYGSKEELYLTILRAQFAEARARLLERGATSIPEELRRMTRAQAVRRLEVRVQTMLDILLGPRSLHATLMLREMCDPSDALPRAVEEFVRPQLEETRRLLAHLHPELGAAEIERAAFSILGQALFYRMMRPAVLLLLGRHEYPRGFTRLLARHITEFSLGGMSRLGARGRKPGKGARVA